MSKATGYILFVDIFITECFLHRKTTISFSFFFFLLFEFKVKSNQYRSLKPVMFIQSSLSRVSWTGQPLTVYNHLSLKTTKKESFEMTCLRQVLRVSWTAKRTNEWVLETAGVSRSLLASVKEMKLAYYGHILRKKGDCLEKELIQGTTPGSRTQDRPKMTWIDNIKSWTGLSLTELTRKVEDRHQWRKFVHGEANPHNEDG